MASVLTIGLLLVRTERVHLIAVEYLDSWIATHHFGQVLLRPVRLDEDCGTQRAVHVSGHQVVGHGEIAEAQATVVHRDHGESDSGAVSHGHFDLAAHASDDALGHLADSHAVLTKPVQGA